MERRAFLKFFQSCQTILVTAIGGGRECVALNRLGFDVAGFECNRQLFEFAEKLFEQGKIEGEFHLVPPDAVCHFGKIYDGAIVGWAAYMLIQGRTRRIDFLKKMRAQMSDGALLLVSFYARRSDEIYFKRLCSIANDFGVCCLEKGSNSATVCSTLMFIDSRDRKLLRNLWQAAFGSNFFRIANTVTPSDSRFDSN